MAPAEFDERAARTLLAAQCYLSLHHRFDVEAAEGAKERRELDVHTSSPLGVADMELFRWPAPALCRDVGLWFAFSLYFYSLSVCVFFCLVGRYFSSLFAVSPHGGGMNAPFVTRLQPVAVDSTPADHGGLPLASHPPTPPPRPQPLPDPQADALRLALRQPQPGGQCDGGRGLRRFRTAAGAGGGPGCPPLADPTVPRLRGQV